MGQPLDILVIEDEAPDAAAVCAALKAEGKFRPEVARTLGEGIERLSSGSFAAVLLDLNLPDSRGLESFERCRQAASDLPVLVLTATGDEATAVAAVRRGAQDYIEKGSDRLELLARSLRYAIERNRLRRRDHHLATHDPLTGLANRGLFEEFLRQSIATADRTKLAFALVYVDLDGFKSVNDLYGHAAGDHLLKTVAGRLKTVIRASDLAARIGGDEFALILNNVANIGALSRVLGVLARMLAEPVPFGSVRLFPKASFGVSVFPTDAAEAGRLLAMADEAMYRAKADGGRRFYFCGGELGRYAKPESPGREEAAPSGRLPPEPNH